MTWGFQTCGPNEAMVVSGESPVAMLPASTRCCRHVASIYEGLLTCFYISNIYTCCQCPLLPGCCHRKPLLVPGGRTFVWPGVQYIQR